jgi:hypothetical protein
MSKKPRLSVGVRCRGVAVLNGQTYVTAFDHRRLCPDLANCSIVLANGCGTVASKKTLVRARRLRYCLRCARALHRLEIEVEQRLLFVALVPVLLA